MIKVLNKQFQPVAILENAFGIGYKRPTNEIYSATFSLPLDDPKNKDFQSVSYVDITDESNGEYIGLFRVDPTRTIRDESNHKAIYDCTHVLSTLFDDILFRYHNTAALSTADTIKYILDRQTTKHWTLGKVDVTRYYSYGWDNTNLISALFSITKPFDVPVRWTYDTKTYPWTLNLEAWSSQPECEIRYGKNLRGIEREVNPSNIVNRWYALGNGDGINQVSIEKINGGMPYVEDATSISKYGLRADIFVDKSIENAETLLNTVQAVLKESKDPKVSYAISAADITGITKDDVDKLKEGRIVRMVDPDFGTFDAPIVQDSKEDMIGQPYGVKLQVANKDGLYDSEIELKERQRINDLYAQGSLSIDSHGFNDNADASYPAVIRFYVPEDAVNINTLDLTFETQKFRAYSKAAKTTTTEVKTTSSGGGTTVTSSSGGGSNITSSSGGGTTVTSSSGGGTTATTSNKTFAQANIVSGVPQNAVGSENYGYHQHEVQIPGSIFEHSHTVQINSHSHSVSISPHSHTVQTPSHSHSVQIDPHVHTLEIPGHGHSLEYGVWENATLPTSVTVKVDGTAVAGTALTRKDLNLIPYLSKDAGGRVKRGEWHTIEITPNNLARINANVISRIFIQSRLGGNY